MRIACRITDLRWVVDGAMHDAVPAIAALGVSPIVRLPDMQSWMVKRKSLAECCRNSVLTVIIGALDAGAHGVCYY